ncbi:hypothetical protein [Companilactobacillus sp.]|uniref:Uncharacterized protein n=1 Tax=Companilactobacillus ginsenosidimutans TaxID=1007676 RepID=A0A0H4QNH9_9LACO|nr:hypothetical protein [Companilactobacillus sp.]AKP66115.1 hypothetical protein ABM34_00115 [Companilactobacillus ginsenosidimutans]AKP68323.1 hypothetical protein ABM34_12750 [Companilactobacillus ginsenosidimutans]
MKVTYENFSTAQEIVGEYVDALFTGRPVYNTDRKRDCTSLELINEIKSGISVMETYYLQQEAE